MQSLPRPGTAGSFALLVPLALLLAACGGSSLPLAPAAPVNPPGDETDEPLPVRAADDVFGVGRSARNQDLDVLRNERGLTIRTLPAQSALGGTLRLITRGNSDPADDLVRYTAPDQSQEREPQDEDRFEYTAVDADGVESSATVTVRLQDRPCLDRPLRAANGLGYCFDAFFTTAHDGTRIDFTVYVPHPGALEDLGGYAPLLLHGHGFGGAKNPDFTLAGHFVDNQVARQAWDRGYFVISFSERGFGASGGQIGLMDPRLEGRDVNELLDWAIKHLRSGLEDFVFDAGNPEHTSSLALAEETRPSLLRDDSGARLPLSGGNPAVGLTGYSYGGGFQYTASHADTNPDIAPVPMQRFDALVPEGTWFDLRYSLHSNQVPKTAWLGLLFTFAVQGGNGEPLPEFLAQGFTEAEVLGKVSPGNQQILKQNSPAFYCDPLAGTSTRASLFHIQGFRDTLFNFNEGYDNALCFEQAGQDVRLLIGVGGHPLPALTQGNYTGHNTSMDIDEIVHCTVAGQTRRYSVREMMFSWFEEKLRGQAGAADGIPKVCIVQENTDPADRLVDENFTDDNSGDANRFRYPKEGLVLERVSEVRVGAGSTPDYVCDSPAGAPQQCLIAATTLSVGPQGESKFVPLYTVTESRLMAGIPTVQLDIDRTLAPTDPIFFIATAVRRNGVVIPIHEQYTPVRDTARYPFSADDASSDGEPIHYGCAYNADSLCERGRLTGISIRLLPGDVVGLQLRGSQEQYANNGSKVQGQVSISGNVELPVYAPSALPPSLNP